MFYTLVLILLSGGNVNATVYSIHDRMDDCFKARNEILIKGNHMNGFFPENTQAVCIRTSVGNIKELRIPSSENIWRNYIP